MTEYLSGASISSGSLIGSPAAVLSGSGFVESIAISLSGGLHIIHASGGQILIIANNTNMRWIASNPQNS